MKKQELIPKNPLLENQKQLKNKAAPQSTLENQINANKAHITEVRFLIFILNGEHFYNWFNQTDPIIRMYQFMFSKIIEKDKNSTINNILMKNLKIENIKICDSNNKNIQWPDDPRPLDQIKISERASGKTNGRSIFNVYIS